MLPSIIQKLVFSLRHEKAKMEGWGSSKCLMFQSDTTKGVWKPWARANKGLMGLNQDLSKSKVLKSSVVKQKAPDWLLSSSEHTVLSYLYVQSFYLPKVPFLHMPQAMPVQVSWCLSLAQVQPRFSNCVRLFG